MKSKIYTKFGDAGQSYLANGKTASKNNPIFKVLGILDLLNVQIGKILVFRNSHACFLELDKLQHKLFDLGAEIAKSSNQSIKISEQDIEILEKWIDQHDETLPVLKNFILPSGKDVIEVHAARAICRQLELELWALHKEEDLSQDILIFINRLSDYFFVISRVLAIEFAIPETIWETGKKLSE